MMSPAPLSRHLRVRLLPHPRILSRSRRGYFFIVDALIATIILFLSLALLITATASAPNTVQAYSTLDSFIQYLSTTQARDISNNVIEGMIRDGNISRTYLSISDIGVELHDRAVKDGCGFCDADAGAMIDSLAQGLIPDQYGYRYSVNGTVIAQRYPETLAQSQLVASQGLVSYFSRNLTEQVGPYATQVQIWVR